MSGTILFFEGFDHEGPNGDDLLTGGIIAATFGEGPAWSYGASTPFNYGRSLNFGWSGVFGPTGILFNASGTTAYCSVAGYVQLTNGASIGGLGVADAATGIQASFTYDTNGYIYIWNGEPTGFNTKTPLGTSPVGTVRTPYGWNHFEFVVLIGGGTTGAAYVFLNGGLVFYVSGVNTQGAAATTCDRCLLTTGQSNNSAIFDELYMCDLTGLPVPTNHGPRRVQTLFPNLNDAVQFTPLANTNWQEVSETTMDGDTSYNYSFTPGQQDTFYHTSLVGNPLIIDAVKVVIAGRIDGATSHAVKPVLKVGTTSYLGSSYFLPATYSYFWTVYPTNPATGTGWTDAAVNANKIGYNLGS